MTLHALRRCPSCWDTTRGWPCTWARFRVRCNSRHAWLWCRLRLGILKKDSFILEALSPKRKFTCESAAAHTLYEKSDPYHLPGPGGAINLENCSFTDIGDGRVEVRGSRFEPTPRYLIKLEGARSIGYRSISIAGTRDPIMIGSIDQILAEVKAHIKEMSPEDDRSEQLSSTSTGKMGLWVSLSL